MACRGEPLRTPIFGITVLIWLIGWVVTLGGVSAATSWLRGISALLGLDWFMVFFSLILVGFFVFIQFRPNLYTQYNHVCYMFLLMTAIVNLYLGDKIMILMLDVPRAPVRPSYSAYLAGLIVCEVVLFVWLIILNLEANVLPARFFYGNSLEFPTKASSAGESTTTTMANHRSTVVGESTRLPDMEMAARRNVTRRSVVPPTGESVETVTMSTNENSKRPMRAKAIFDYEKNKSDTQEISFHAGDIFEVISPTGKWWQCRKLDSQGNVIDEGYAPSNYLEKLSED